MSKIKVTKNGPYVVSGNVPLGKESSVPNKENIPVDWKKGEKIPNTETYSLCRCGKSKTKPFCSGAHAEAKFDGTEDATDTKFDDQSETYEGPNLLLRDVESFCAGARFCEIGTGIWNETEKSDDEEKRESAIKVACNCPSGRLVMCDKKTGEKIEPEFEETISVTEDLGAELSGPLWVKGGIPVESGEGKEYEKRNRVTLCRCGNSKNKPFCDGSHLNTNFTDDN